MPKPDLTVIICTRNRADSLRITLDALARTDRVGIRAEVVVVDNASTDATQAVVKAAATCEAAPPLPLRYLFEPGQGNYGTSHALNRAIDAGDLGDVVAVLDDDLTVERDWCLGVLAIARRWPRGDFFTGRSYVVWPDVPVPTWAKYPPIQGWMFSVQDSPSNDAPLAPGQWFTGGHFWFRSRVLTGGCRFEDTWATEPVFMLQLIAAGAQAYRGRDAAAGHRIQAQLLDPEVALERAVKVGRSYARARLDPRSQLRHSRWSRAHPGLARAYVTAQRIRWTFIAFLRRHASPSSIAFGRRLAALERAAAFSEMVHILNSRRDPSRRVVDSDAGTTPSPASY